MKLKPELVELLALLKEANTAVSAKELAEEMHCSLPTVYSRLYALARAGVVIVESRYPHSVPGPTPVRYRLAQQQVQVPRA